MAEEKSLTIPQSYQEISSMAKAFVASGMFTDTKQLSQAIVKIQAGKELGLPPVYSMQNINMIRNRLTTSANTMAMLVKKSGNYNYRIKEHTDIVCTITFFEKDGDKWTEVGESTFTMDDANRAGLVKPDSGWEKYPRAMLFSRSISQGARLYCPDAIGGVYTDEEIRSIPPNIGVNDQVDTSAEEVIETEKESIETEVVPEVTSPEPPKEEQSPESSIDMDWVKESLKQIKWTEKTAATWLTGKYKVDGGLLEDVIAQLTEEQQAEFVKEIRDRLEMV